MSNFRDTLKQTLTRELFALRDDIRANLASTGTNASGHTSESLRVEVDSEGGRLIGRPAFHVVETGRIKTPGKYPRNFYQIIKQWTYDKGLTFTNEQERGTFAYFVSRKIIREGSQLHRRGGRDDIYTNVLPKHLAAIWNSLLYAMDADVERINATIPRKTEIE